MHVLQQLCQKNMPIGQGSKVDTRNQFWGSGNKQKRISFAPDRGRTCDFLLRKQTLYPLSYRRNHSNDVSRILLYLYFDSK